MRNWALGILTAIALILIVAILLRAPAPEPVDETIAPPPAVAPTPVAAPPEVAAVTPRPEPVPVVPMAPRPGVVGGQVFQPDGRPAVAAEIRYTWRASEHQPPVADGDDYVPTTDTEPMLTDEAGRFALHDLPRGEMIISARHATGMATQRLRLTAHNPLQEITLILEGGLSLAGKVVERGGQGIAGARVMPLGRDGGRYFAHNSEARAVLADEGGNFRLENLVVGAWTLHVSAPGFGSAISPPIHTGIENARIVLSAGVDLHCQVLRSEDASPAPGLTVRLAYSDHNVAPTEISSDDQGNVTFANLGAGSYDLDVEDDHLALVGQSPTVVIDPVRKPESITLHVSAGGEIQGHLMDGATKAGIPGIVLRATHGERRIRFYSSTTDGSGAYSLTGLPAGTYSVKPPPRIPGYPQDPIQPLEKNTSVSAGGVSEGVDFEITAGAPLGGIVLDDENNPVAGVAVRARAVEGRQNMAEYFTAADGRFRFGNFSEGEAVNLAAATQAARSGLVGPFMAGTPGSDAIELRLSLDCTAIIAGRVFDRAGKPFACKIMAIAEEENLQFPVVWPTAETDGAGNFVLAEVCAGTYALHIVPRSNARQAAQTVVVGPGESLLGLTLVYDQGELLDLSGVVEDRDGNPVPGARLTSMFINGSQRSQGGHARADENGRFVFRDLPAGTYGISASAHGFTGADRVEANAGDEGVVVQMIRAPQVSGVVTGAGGKPVESYTLSLIASPNPGRAPIVQQVSDGQGQFSVTLPGRGGWMLRVEAEGYGPGEVDLGRIREGEEVADISIVLEGNP